MTKRILSMALVLCLLLALLPTVSAVSFAEVQGTTAETTAPAEKSAQNVRKSDTDVAYPVEGGNIYFDKGSGTITDCDKDITSANIPAEIDGVAVKSIAANAFSFSRSLKSVTIPEGVVSIGKWAFQACNLLPSIKLPDSLESIGPYAFSDCAALKSLTIPKNVSSIGYQIVELSKNFEAFYVDDANTSFTASGGALFNFDMTELLCVPYSFTAYTVPAGVEKIADRAFYYNSKLERVSIPEGVKSIGVSAFRYCEALTNVQLPVGMETIGDSAFSYCTGLKSVSIPNTVTKIDFSAFYGCDALTEVLIPASVTTIKASAFGRCAALKAITVAAENPAYSSDSKGILFNKDKTSLIQAPCAIDSYVIPEGVTKIESSAFDSCKALTSVTMPNTVTEAGFSAFESCGALNEVKLSDSLTTMSSGMFWKCTALKKIVIPAAVRQIKSSAFYGCSALQCALFLGDAPEVSADAFDMSYGYGIGYGTIAGLTLYYIDGKAGWTTPTWGDKAYQTETWDGVTFPHIHEYATTVVAPTCTENGYTLNTCACGNSYTDTSIEALGHYYKDGLCTRCGAKDPDYVGHIHKYYEHITLPTCSAKGYTTFSCSCGESYRDNYTDALGHEYKDGKCTRCGKIDPSTVNVSFRDVSKNAWYKEAVDYAVSNGLMNGMGNNTFEPDTATNRAMLVTILWRYAGSPVDGTNDFADVPNGQWFTQAVAWAAKNGIVTGVGNNKFDPEGKLTREQLATILFRYAKMCEIDTSARAEFGKFEDGKKVQSWSKEAVQWAVAEGIIGGTSENGKLYLDPQGNATRAQVATILMRFIENVLKK